MKVEFGKYIFLSIEQQKILLQMHQNGGSINYKDQGVYKNEIAFNRSMNILFEAGAVKLAINDEYYNVYLLTSAGKFLCKHGIIPLKKIE